ncbi:MAG: hypothetical protein ACOCUO_01110 [archaeon]
MTANTPEVGLRRSGTEFGLSVGPGSRVLRGLVQGVVGGLIATVLMTLYRFPVFRALPPTADFWAKYVGNGDPESYPGPGLILHFLYGGAAGGLFGAAINALDLHREGEGGRSVIGLSLAYGLALSGFGTRFVFRHLLDEELETDEAVIFHVGHVMYGLTLGTWMSFSDRSGEVYE